MALHLLIDHAYLSSYNQKNSLLHMPFQSIYFQNFQYFPRLPSLTCLAHAVENHMKEIIINITSDK